MSLRVMSAETTPVDTTESYSYTAISNQKGEVSHASSFFPESTGANITMETYYYGNQSISPDSTLVPKSVRIEDDFWALERKMCS